MRTASSRSAAGTTGALPAAREVGGKPQARWEAGSPPRGPPLRPAAADERAVVLPPVESPGDEHHRRPVPTASRAATAASGMVAMLSSKKVDAVRSPSGSRRWRRGWKPGRASTRDRASTPAWSMAARAAQALTRLWRPRSWSRLAPMRRSPRHMQGVAVGVVPVGVAEPDRPPGGRSARASPCPRG